MFEPSIFEQRIQVNFYNINFIHKIHVNAIIKILLYTIYVINV